MMRRPSAQLLMRLSGGTIRAEAHRHGTPWWAAEASYGTAQDLADAIARLAAELPARCRSAAIVIDHPPAQIRTIPDLPPVASRDLTALVAHQASRYFRKNGAPLATDAVWVQKHPTRVAQAVAVEEPVLDAIHTGLDAAGIRSASIRVAGSRTDLELRSARTRARRSREARRWWRGTAVLTLGIWGSVGTGWVLRLTEERRAVDRELAALTTPLAALAKARKDIREANAVVGSIRAAEESREASMDLLGGVAAALPDSALLTSLNWNADGTGVLTGTARRAAEVLADIERRGLVASPRLDGPVIREALAGRTWDRFTITFGAVPGVGRHP